MSSTPVVIIPCTGAKLDRPAPAAELYIGATFQPALKAARTLVGDTGRVLILSALHGLVELDAVIAPYDVRMGDAAAVDQPDRIAELADQLAPHAGERVFTLLPNAYRHAIQTALAGTGAGIVNLYAGCRGIGDQRGVCRRVAAGELAEVLA